VPAPVLGVAALALSPSPSPFYQRCLELLAHEVEDAGWSLICHHARYEDVAQLELPLERLRPRTRLVQKPYSLVMLVESLREMLRAGTP